MSATDGLRIRVDDDAIFDLGTIGPLLYELGKIDGILEFFEEVERITDDPGAEYVKDARRDRAAYEARRRRIVADLDSHGFHTPNL